MKLKLLATIVTVTTGFFPMAYGGTPKEMAEVRLQDANNFGAQGKFPEAIYAYTAALSLDPLNPDCWGGRGMAYFLIGNYQQSISDCTRAIAIAPMHAFYYYIRG